MRDGRGGRRQRRAAIGVLGVAVSAALVLSACSSGDSSGGSAPGASANNASGGGGGSAQASTVSIAITPAGSNTIGVTTPIVVKISGGTLKSVTVTNPNKGTTVAGTTSSDGTTWTSNEPLAFGTAYQVDAVGQDSSGRTADQKGTVTTVTPAATTNSNMVPGPASVAGAGIGVGQPIVFQFTRPVKNRALVQSHLKVTSSAGDTCTAAARTSGPRTAPSPSPRPPTAWTSATACTAPRTGTRPTRCTTR
jgi:Big-like domain-containing protein